MNPKIHHQLPSELNNEIFQFVPGSFCRRVLNRTNFLFYALAQRSKRGKYWRTESVNDREQNTSYSHDQRVYHALVPRLEHHRYSNDFLAGLNDVNNFFRSDGANGRICIVSIRAVNGSRQMVRDFFTENSQLLGAKHTCDITFFPMDTLEWDLIGLTLYSELFAMSWDDVMGNIHTVLSSIENGIQPPPVVLNSSGSSNSLPSV